MSKPNAILLVGPTGSGKTPLGELLQRRPLWGNLHAHFDFGAQLRLVASGAGAAGALSETEAETVAAALANHALLEDAQWPIAERIVRAFLAGCPNNELVVLNGLPRHLGQARDMDAIVDIQAVIQLHCDAEVVRRRIGANAGGDRTGRTDDDLPSVQRKLDIFQARTAPLVEHYRAAGARIETVTVGAAAKAEDCLAELNRRVAS